MSCSASAIVAAFTSGPTGGAVPKAGGVPATDPVTEKLAALTLRTKKSDISVRLVALARVPFRRETGGAAPFWM